MANRLRPRPLSPADRISRSGGAIFAEIDDQVVALDAAKGVCYGLDAIGARIWLLIAPAITVTDLCDQLVTEYLVDRTDCERDVRDLLLDLAKVGLVEIDSAGGAVRAG